jgi:hypothetical protein
LWIIDLSVIVFVFYESINISDVILIDKEGRVGRKKKLCSVLFTYVIEKDCKFLLELRVDMEFWFIDNHKSIFEVISVDRENN